MNNWKENVGRIGINYGRGIWEIVWPGICHLHVGIWPQFDDSKMEILQSEFCNNRSSMIEIICQTANYTADEQQHMVRFWSEHNLYLDLEASLQVRWSLNNRLL